MWLLQSELEMTLGSEPSSKSPPSEWALQSLYAQCPQRGGIPVRWGPRAGTWSWKGTSWLSPCSGSGRPTGDLCHLAHAGGFRGRVTGITELMVDCYT